MDHFIKIPLCRQATSYTCGPAALQSILGYYNMEYNEEFLSKELHCICPTGTDFRWILRFCNNHQFHAIFSEHVVLTTVKHYIQQDIPILLLIQSWADAKGGQPYLYSTSNHDNNHYVVACGFTNDCILFMDPSTLGHYTYLKEEELMKRWHLQDEFGIYEQSIILITPTFKTAPFDENKLYYLW